MAKHSLLWRSVEFIFGQLIMLGPSTGVFASWRDSGRVTHELTERAPATPAEGYLVFCFVFLVFFCCFVKHAASPGFKSLTRVTSTEILLRLSGVTVHQVQGARCSPRGGCTLSRAGRSKAGPQRRARAARKKKKKAPDWDPPSVCDRSIFSDWSRLHLENRAEQGRDSAAEGEN